MKTIIETLKRDTEVNFNIDGEEMFARLYSDGGVKIEGNNSLEFFDNIEEASKYLKKYIK